MINEQDIEEMIASEGAGPGLDAFFLIQRELETSQTNIPKTYHRFGSFGLSIKRDDPDFDLDLLKEDIKNHKIRNLVIEKKLTKAQVLLLADYLGTDCPLKLIGFEGSSRVSNEAAISVLNEIAKNNTNKITSIVFSGENITDETVNAYHSLWEKGLLSSASIKLEDTKITEDSIKLLTKIVCLENSSLSISDFKMTLESNKNITQSAYINAVYIAAQKNKFNMWEIFDLLFGARYELLRADANVTNIKRFVLFSYSDIKQACQLQLNHEIRFAHAKIMVNKLDKIGGKLRLEVGSLVSKLDKICDKLRLDETPFIDWIILKSNISTLDQLNVFVNRVCDALSNHKRSAAALFTIWAIDQKRESCVTPVGRLPVEIVNRILQISADDTIFPILRESTDVENPSEKIEACFKKPFFNLI